MTTMERDPAERSPRQGATEKLTNWQAVARNGQGKIVVQAPRVRMSGEEALVHAAWLVALASLDVNEADAKFARILKAIREG